MRRSLASLPLAMTAVLLWLGAFSLWTPTASEVLAAPASPYPPPTVQATDAGGYGPPMDAGLFAVLADEDAAGDDLLAKTGLLMVLVLAIFVGPVLWELGASCGGCLGAKARLLGQCYFHSGVRCRQGRHVVTLLAVFRL